MACLRRLRIRPRAGVSHLAQAPFAGMLAEREEAGGLQVRVGQQRIGGMQRHGRHIGLAEQLEPLGGGPGEQQLCQLLVQRADVLGARGHAGVARVGFELGLAAQRPKERSPVPIGVDHRAHEAVLRAVRAAIRVEHARVTQRADRRIEGMPGEMVAQHEAGHHLEHRHLDLLALPGAAALVQRGTDLPDRPQRDTAIHEGGGRVARLAAIGHVRQPGNGHRALDQVVERGFGRVGSALPVAEQPGVDDARIDRRHRRVVQAQARHRCRAHVGDHHIGRADQIEGGRQPRRLLQVEDQAAFAAVDVQEDRAHARVAHRPDPAHRVAAGRFDLDHIGPHVAQDLGGVGRHQHARDVDDPHAVQGACGHGALGVRGRIEVSVATPASTVRKMSWNGSIAVSGVESRASIPPRTGAAGVSEFRIGTDGAITRDDLSKCSNLST